MLTRRDFIKQIPLITVPLLIPNISVEAVTQKDTRDMVYVDIYNNITFLGSIISFWAVGGVFGPKSFTDYRINIAVYDYRIVELLIGTGTMFADSLNNEERLLGFYGLEPKITNLYFYKQKLNKPIIWNNCTLYCNHWSEVKQTNALKLRVRSRFE